MTMYCACHCRSKRMSSFHSHMMRHVTFLMKRNFGRVLMASERIKCENGFMPFLKNLGLVQSRSKMLARVKRL